MYTVGTSVLYGRMGVCRIESISVPPFQGNSQRFYYKLCALFSSCSETVYLPVDAAKSVRPLIGREEAEQFLGLLAGLTPPVYHARQQAELTAHYQKLLSSGDLKDRLLLLKSIYRKEAELAERKKRLGQVDIRYLKLAERLVCEEFAAALDTTPDQMRSRVQAAMTGETLFSS